MEGNYYRLVGSRQGDFSNVDNNEDNGNDKFENNNGNNDNNHKREVCKVTLAML